MASELAGPPSNHIPPSDSLQTTGAQQPYGESNVNGEDQRYVNETTAPHIDSAIDAPSDAPVGPTDIAIDVKASLLPPLDPNPSGPTPVADIAEGIQPVADFIPKDSTHLSHPTPPPDEPLTTGAADVDVEMANAEEVSESAPVEEVGVETTDVEVASGQSEQSLVRPREDDGEDEPSAKRTKLDDESDSASPSGMAAAPSVEPTEAVTASIMETVDEPAVDATEASMTVPSPRPAPSAELVSEAPVAEATQSVGQTEATTSEEVNVEATQPEAQAEMQMTDAPEESIDGGSAVVNETQLDAGPAKPIVKSDAQSTPAPASQAAAATPSQAKYSTEPMTSVQKSYLVEKTKNLKKTKHSGPFLRPVDPVALNIPSYPEIVKQPMDLSTMESKLKKGDYGSVQAFADDFDLILGNVRRFNGDAHAITQIGFNLDAYFRKMMEGVPTASMAAPPRVEKKRSPSVQHEKPPRRESRQVAPPAAPTAPAASGAASAADTYALQADGTPQIRRQSSNRPARAIKPPANREIPYAKPKRKAHQLELRFCEHVLHEISSARYGALNHPFLAPVDPVALNIPQYHSVIKSPMDLGTMNGKLKQGEYGTAAEFKKDFDQVIKNCMAFNPAGNPVRDMAIQLQREFETLWNEKVKWERKNQPPSNRASSASADDDSAADDDDDEDDDGDDKNATILALQKQLAEMQNALSGMAGTKPSKKKAKTAKPSKKVSMSDTKRNVAKPKTKSKKSRNVTYEDKQEISEAVPKMSDSQVAELTSIITTNSARHREMGDEMELEIDDLPNDVQIMLLDFVRKIFGNPKKKARDPSPDDAAALDDDDFEPARRGSGVAGKRKKHKPMGKKEQQDAISSLRGKLAQYQGATSASESPTNSSFAVKNEDADTSGDEESEESEEE